MAIGVGESHDQAPQPMNRGLRARSFDVLLRCFARSVGADNATLFARDDQRGTHVAAAWTREGPAAPAPERPDALVERALAGGGALVDSAIDANGHQRHRAVAAAFSSDRAGRRSDPRRLRPPGERSLCPADLDRGLVCGVGGALHVSRRAARRRARFGQLRRAHRLPRPHGDRGGPRRGDRALEAAGSPVVVLHDRPRPVQADQRQPSGTSRATACSRRPVRHFEARPAATTRSAASAETSSSSFSPRRAVTGHEVSASGSAGRFDRASPRQPGSRSTPRSARSSGMARSQPTTSSARPIDRCAPPRRAEAGESRPTRERGEVGANGLVELTRHLVRPWS